MKTCGEFYLQFTYLNTFFLQILLKVIKGECILLIIYYFYLQAQQSPIYVNVAKRASPVRKASSELISVSLVSEVNKGLNSSLNKQNSNSSLTSSLSGHSLNNGKGPPPPYVQPPQPQVGPGAQGGSGGLRIPPVVSVSGPSSHQVQTRSVSVQGELRNSEIRNSELRISNSGIAAPQVPTSSSIATYANVQFRVKGKRKKSSNCRCSFFALLFVACLHWIRFLTLIGP